MDEIVIRGSFGVPPPIFTTGDRMTSDGHATTPFILMATLCAALGLSSCHKPSKPQKPQGPALDGGDRRQWAFYGTRFGMSPPEVTSTLSVHLENCAEATRGIEAHKGTIGYDIELSCNINDPELIDTYWKSHSEHWFAFNLSLYDERFDADFEFFDGGLDKVTADFQLDGVSPDRHEALEARIESRLRATMGAPSHEPLGNEADAGSLRYRSGGREAVLTNAPGAKTPLLDFEIWDAALRDAYDKAKRVRDNSAFR